ncbi:MAG: transglutaminase family protein [Cyanobacteriota bacterium]|nr:transglutaminase family protein [Cyanobacteriota bacterium]
MTLWMETLAERVRERLAEADLQLTLGGEPTLVPVNPEGAEWSITADGPTKLPLARRLAAVFQRDVWPGGTLLYCPGKLYAGEVNPRWALRLLVRADGTPLVRQRDRQATEPAPVPLRVEEAPAWLARLGERLGVRLRPLALRDPLDEGRQAWAAPLTALETGEDGQERGWHWQAGDWPLADALAQLSGAPGPAGLRLPLLHFPAELPRQVLTLEVDQDGWELFLPPLLRVPLESLLQAVEDGLTGLTEPRLSGMLPSDAEDHWQVLGLTADPGVLEINLPVCHGWSDYARWLRRMEAAAEVVGLRTWKEADHGGQEGTGGGNHLLWGGASLATNPFFPRPAWLAGLLRYWQHHPSLSYLFSGSSVGPASQAPRPDEASGTIFDLELAYRQLELAEEQPSQEPWGDHRALIGETLRHLHADRSGNNHRSEISFDKFWNPGTPAGCLGLIEFRALESLPRLEWSQAIALLWSGLAAHLLDPAHRPRRLRPWGDALHDRCLLPSQLWADLRAVLAELAAADLRLEEGPFRELWEWRFPPLLAWNGEPVDGGDRPSLELRPALEPWPLICDFPREGGFTSRFVDGSLRRFEITANSAFRAHGWLALQGRSLPLDPDPSTLLAVRYRFQRLYPCLHPGIAPDWPLRLIVGSPSGVNAYVLTATGERFLPVDLDASDPRSPEGLLPWRGRERPEAITLDLRLEGLGLVAP